MQTILGKYKYIESPTQIQCFNIWDTPHKLIAVLPMPKDATEIGDVIYNHYESL